MDGAIAEPFGPNGRLAVTGPNAEISIVRNLQVLFKISLRRKEVRAHLPFAMWGPPD